MDRQFATIALSVVAASCGTSQTEDAVVCGSVEKAFPTALVPKIDLLIVVDSSPSFEDERDALPAQLGRWANVLENIEGGLPDLHVGVVSSDVARHSGALQSAGQLPGCAPLDAAFLVDLRYANGERERNYEQDFADALACIGTLPGDGSRIEEPLEAMRRALRANNGFRRSDAFLLVLFVGDEDDCSGGAGIATADTEAGTAWQCLQDAVQCETSLDLAGSKDGCVVQAEPAELTTVDEYAAELRALAPDPAMVMVAATTSTAAPEVVTSGSEKALASACSGTNNNTAYPTPRLSAFLEQFPNRNTSVDVCSDDWSEALILVAQRFTTVTGSPCLDPKVDLVPEAPGIQAECVVTEVRASGSRVLPNCSSPEAVGAGLPCWSLSTDDGYGEECIAWRAEPVREFPEPSTVFVECFTGCE